jgi:tyrosyl-tRNA synthetase
VGDRTRDAAGWSLTYPTLEGPRVSIDPTLLDDLEWRGLIAHSTDLDALREALGQGSVRFYVGFDPTAPSLHMGNLVQLVTARRLQDAGHTPYLLVGGATGMIGDPKESGERTLNSLDTVKEWVEKMRHQIEPFLSFEGPNAATMVNNYDWTASMSVIDFLRDIGKHFPVNRMLARDVVRSRLEAGISFTEFSYVLLQSMDFLNLYRDHGVTLQHGGSDQWGNLTGGVELVRRSDAGHVHAFATPLIERADGTKYGKTEAGALWLDPEMMSPYAFYQFWLNVEDEKVVELLKIFTFLDREQIAELEVQTAEKPFLRAGQKALAEQVTTLVHGAEEAEHARAASAALFGGGDLRALSPSTLAAALTEAGAARLGPSEEVPALVDLLVLSGLARSKGEARRTVGEGGAYLNNERIEDPDYVPTDGDLIGGSWLVLRRGKKHFAGVELGRT